MQALPPGPRSGLLTLWRYGRDPYGSTMRLFARYGDPCTVRTLGTPMVSTGDPQLIRAILAADTDTFEAFGVDLMAPVLGRESLILLSGEPHRAARKLLTPPFHGARMRTYGVAMQEAARDEARRWTPGSPFAMQQATQAVSLRIILQAVFGITERGALGRYEHALVAAIEALTPMLMFVKSLQHELGGIGPWARLQRRTRAVEAMVYEELAARRAAPSEREDILSLLMAARYDDGEPMTDRQLFETLMTVIVAGHETTAIATAWACYFVHRDAAVRDRLLAELRDVPSDAGPDVLAALPYLEATCHEALRIHPVAGAIARTLRRPFELGAWTLPAGVAVSASITALHRRPELFPEPDVFRPERFLDRTFAPHEYMPFGGGYRRCIGAAFALYEMKIVLATILRERPLKLARERPGERPIGAKPRSTVIGAARPIWFAVQE